MPTAARPTKCVTTFCTRYLSGKRFAEAVRGHWGIESMHWVLDVNFREDDSRTRERTLGNNLSWLRRFAVTLLKRHPAKDSLRGKMIRCMLNTDFLTEVLTLQGLICAGPGHCPASNMLRACPYFKKARFTKVSVPRRADGYSVLHLDVCGPEIGSSAQQFLILGGIRRCPRCSRPVQLGPEIGGDVAWQSIEVVGRKPHLEPLPFVGSEPLKAKLQSVAMPTRAHIARSKGRFAACRNCRRTCAMFIGQSLRVISRSGASYT